MKKTLLHSLLVAFLMIAGGFSSPVHAQEFTLSKGDVSSLKILGHKADQIHLYLTDQSDNVFHFAALTEKDAHWILDQFKMGGSLSLVTSLNDRGYLSVTSFK